MSIQGPRSEFHESVLESHNKITIAVSSLLVMLYPSEQTALTNKKTALFWFKAVSLEYTPAFVLRNYKMTVQGLIEKVPPAEKWFWYLELTRSSNLPHDNALERHFKEVIQDRKVTISPPVVPVRDPSTFEDPREALSLY